MNNRTSVALLGAIVAAALHSAEAFAPTTSLRLRLSPTTTGDCRCRSTEASLFRRKKKNDAFNELGPSTPHGVIPKSMSRMVSKWCAERVEEKGE